VKPGSMKSISPNEHPKIPENTGLFRGGVLYIVLNYIVKSNSLDLTNSIFWRPRILNSHHFEALELASHFTLDLIGSRRIDTMTLPKLSWLVQPAEEHAQPEAPKASSPLFSVTNKSLSK
jgi:hypothetical protein